MPEQDVGRQARSDALRADLAALLSGSGQLSEVLNACCRILVERLGVAFVRIWLLAPGEQVLKLAASAGIYTRIDGTHAQVPVGQYKIGLIARQRRPHMTNSVQGDSLVHDQEWAQREGMVAFAGYPLVAEDQVVGVLAMFSRRPIAAEDFSNLQIIAGIVAHYVRRKQAEQALQIGEARFRRLAESIAVIPWEADGQTWCFTYVGPQAAQILGYPPEDWYAPGFWVDHIHPADREAAVEFCRQRIERGECDYQFEYRMVKPDGTVVWLLDIVNVIIGPSGAKTLQGYLIDITERKQAEQKIQESQQRFQLMADALPVLIAYIDAQGRFQFNNAAYEQWFGIPAEGCRGRLVREILGEAAYEAIRGHFEAALAGEARSFEERIPYHGAGPRDVHVHYVPHRTPDGQVAGFFALIIDFSERKALEKQVLEISAQEHQRIAQELHDGLGQELTGLSLLADALARRLHETVPEEQQLATKLARGLERMHQQVRALCRGLIMTQLDPDALRLALQELAERTTEQTGVLCTLDCLQQPQVADSITASHLYRIVQEAVSNALRHGRPRQIWLTLRDTSEGLCVSVRDDGSGLAEPTSNGSGMGIPTMRYRAGMVGGILQIRPAAGGGTIVTCTLPRKTTHAKN